MTDDGQTPINPLEGLRTLGEQFAGEAVTMGLDELNVFVKDLFARLGTAESKLADVHLRVFGDQSHDQAKK